MGIILKSRSGFGFLAASCSLLAARQKPVTRSQEPYLIFYSGKP